MKMISLERIWDQADHNGLTDLIKNQGTFFCCFREGTGHCGDENHGSIRILKSYDAKKWESAAFLSKPKFDLRDPHFSIMPDGRLMLTLGGSIYKNGKYCGCYPQVAFSENGLIWTEIKQLPLAEEWIWRMTWHHDWGYGFSYRMSQPKHRDKPWHLSLFRSKDGLSYECIKEFNLPDYPSEATIRFTKEGNALAFLRRRHKTALIGTAPPPFVDWDWTDCGYCIGGPNFIILSDGTIWAGGRDYQAGVNDPLGYTLGKMFVGQISENKYLPLIELKSAGDNGYPGFVYENGILYTSYYSSHEGKPSIYLAQIKV